MEKTDTSYIDAMNSPARVFQTRHILHGFVWPRWNDRFQNPRQEPIYAKGVLKAPDHADLILQEVHVLRRAVGMIGDPLTAD